MSVFDNIRPPAFSFADRGTMNTSRGGEIVKIEGLDNEIKATVYKKPDTIKTWNGQPDGDPVYQVVVTVQSNERDPDNPLDEGLRTFWFEQTSRKRPSQWTAFVTALESAGCAKNPQVGGKLWLAWVGEEAVPNATNPQKVWKAKYEAPTGAALNGQADPFDITPAQPDPFARSAQKSDRPGDPMSQEDLRSAIERHTTEEGLRVLWKKANVTDADLVQLVKDKIAHIRAQASQPSIYPFATSAPVTSAPFSQPTTPLDPLATIERELADPTLSEDGLKALWVRAGQAGIADAALGAKVKAKLEQLRQPAVVDPFDPPATQGPWD